MTRRKMMKLAALGLLLPRLTGAATANAETTAALTYRVFTAIRAGRDVPPGHLRPEQETLKWIANSATLITGARDAVLVDTFMTVEQCGGLADAIAASGKTLRAIYVTHGHPDHFFGLRVLQDRFPQAQALATPEVVAKMKLQAAPDKLVERREQFAGLPDVIAIADPLDGNTIDLEGHQLVVVKVGHTDTDDTTCLHVPSIGLVVAGDVVYNGIHPFLGESTRQTRLDWIAALDTIAALRPSAVVAGHKLPGHDDSPHHVGETRQYLRDFIRLNDATKTAVELYDQMLALYPDRANPGSLWNAAATAKAQA